MNRREIQDQIVITLSRMLQLRKQLDEAVAQLRDVQTALDREKQPRLQVIGGR